MSPTVDSMLVSLAKKATERVSENMNIVANEPSLALYRIQEHVRKSLPPLVDKQREVLHLAQDLQGCLYDIEYAISAVNSMEMAESSLEKIKESMNASIFWKQQLNCLENKRRKNEASMYRRLSSHISKTLDVKASDSKHLS